MPGDPPPAADAVEHDEGDPQDGVVDEEVDDLPEHELRGEAPQRGDPVDFGSGAVPAPRPGSVGINYHHAPTLAMSRFKKSEVEKLKLKD